MKKLFGAGLAMLLSFTIGTPAQALEDSLGEPTTGFLVQALPAFSDTLPAPSVAPADNGNMLVTWYGHESVQCAHEAEPSCVTLFQIFNESGEAITPATRMPANAEAPSYYGSSQASWNPEAREWVVYWRTYSDLAVNPGDSYLYMQRVSEDGEFIGDVYAQTDSGYDPVGDEVVTGLNNGANDSLIWLESQSKWLLMAYQYNPSAYITYTIFDSELNHLSGEQQIIVSDAVRSNPYGVQVAENPDTGEILFAYATNQTVYEVRSATIEDNQLVVSDPVVYADETLVPGTRKAVVELAFNPTKGTFVAAYPVRESGIWYIQLAEISGGAVPAVEARYNAITYPAAVTSANRPYMAFNAADEELYVVQNVTFADNGAALAVLSANDYSLVEPLRQLAETEFDYTSQRPVLGSHGDDIGFAYLSFVDGGWGDNVRILAGRLTFSEREPEPTPYRGPRLDQTPQQAKVGDRVTYTGSNLSVVESATVGGKPVQNLAVTSKGLTFTVPDLAAGIYDLVATFDGGKVSVQRALEITGPEEPSYWTKRISGKEAKLYAKNIVGAGKVQFFLNGRQVAWVRAVDESDPKLRSANGAHYLVRTVALAQGKNVLEVKVNGQREKRVVYSR